MPNDREEPTTTSLPTTMRKAVTTTPSPTPPPQCYSRVCTTRTSRRHKGVLTLLQHRCKPSRPKPHWRNRSLLQSQRTIVNAVFFFTTSSRQSTTYIPSSTRPRFWNDVRFCGLATRRPSNSTPALFLCITACSPSVRLLATGIPSSSAG